MSESIDSSIMLHDDDDNDDSSDNHSDKTDPNNDNVARMPSSAPSSPTTSTYVSMKRLPIDFQPGPFDVICARGKKSSLHSGNQRLRVLLEMNRIKYAEATSKLQKSIIVSSIVDTVRESSPSGGFVREENGIWYEVGDQIAREKCGQGFRDLLHTKYKSSTRSKLSRRKIARTSREGMFREYMMNEYKRSDNMMSPSLAQPNEQLIPTPFSREVRMNSELMPEITFKTDPETDTMKLFLPQYQQQDLMSPLATFPPAATASSSSVSNLLPQNPSVASLPPLHTAQIDYEPQKRSFQNEMFKTRGQTSNYRPLHSDALLYQLLSVQQSPTVDEQQQQQQQQLLQREQQHWQQQQHQHQQWQPHLLQQEPQRLIQKGTPPSEELSGESDELHELDVSRLNTSLKRDDKIGTNKTGSNDSDETEFDYDTLF